MSQHSYLIFELNGTAYGIPTIAVREIFLLPTVTPIAEASIGVLGVINVRGTILSIVDLHALLKLPAPPLQATDSIIVVQSENQQVGIVVQQVNDVQFILPDQIQTHYQQTLNCTSRFPLVGIATLDSKLVTLIDPVELFRNLKQAGLCTTGSNHQSNDHETAPSDTHFRHHLYDHLPPNIQQLLQQRSLHLQTPFTSEDTTSLIPLAVIQLNQEYFGIGLELVQELVTIRKITAIPCCPDHILGNMNLRGEIITLVDMSHLLNLLCNTSQKRPKAIIARWQDAAIGIAVDDVVDVTYIDLAQVAIAPVAIQPLNHDYLQGIVRYQEKMMSVIDLEKLIMSESLVVNETV